MYNKEGSYPLGHDTKVTCVEFEGQRADTTTRGHWQLESIDCTGCLWQ